jgi:hypothetical protein
MKLYHKNPRQISKRQYAKLEESLKELGDLSSIVHDLNSDEIIGGNQRSRVFDINDCEVQIVKEYPQPDAQGTTALGFVVWNGAPFAYRQVRWTAEQCERANLAANNIGGTWEWQELSGWDKSTLEWAGFDQDTLNDWGQNYSNLKGLIESEAPATPSAENEEIPEQFAIMITCESEQEQTQLLDRFITEGITCRALIY